MQQFRISPEGLASIRKKVLYRAILTSIISLSFAVTIVQLANPDEELDPTNLLITLVVGGGLITFGLFKGIQKQKKMLEAFTLTIDDNVITREQAPLLEMQIYYHEVKQIIQNSTGGFTIKGRDRSDVIYIPAQLERFEELRTLLSGIKPIEELDKKSKVFAKMTPFLTIPILGCMLIVYTVENKVLVGIAGTIMIAFAGYAMYTVITNKQIENRAKRGIWGLVIVIISVLYVSLNKILGPFEWW